LSGSRVRGGVERVSITVGLKSVWLTLPGK
jgi:hypothetical protein